MKAIDSNYKKIFYDKSKQKYNKEIFWGMVGALMASANIINGIKNIEIVLRNKVIGIFPFTQFTYKNRNYH